MSTFRYIYISDKGRFVYCFNTLLQISGYVPENKHAEILSANHYQYLTDHRKYGIIAIVIVIKNKYLYVLITKEPYHYRGQKKLLKLNKKFQYNYGKVHYVNDTELLKKNLTRLRNIAYRKYHLIGLHFNENILNNAKISFSKKKNTGTSIIYKHNLKGNVEIDTLYSELFLLK